MSRASGGDRGRGRRVARRAARVREGRGDRAGKGPHVGGGARGPRGEVPGPPPACAGGHGRDPPVRDRLRERGPSHGRGPRARGLRQGVLEDAGTFRQYVTVFVNGDQVTAGDPARVRLKDGDTVHVLPSVAGAWA